MNLLVDTHLLLWSAANSAKLPKEAKRLLSSPGNSLWFSVVSIWEVAIKRSLDKRDFKIDAGPLRAGLLANKYLELPVEGRHVLSLVGLPFHHNDPFDRLLLAQAISDGLTLVTTDAALALYAGPVRLVS